MAVSSKLAVISGTGANRRPPVDLFDLAQASELESIHFRNDAATGLQAIIAIHCSSRGPALGGTRFLPYKSSSEAIADAIRLARGMSYKSACAGLPYGGGKAVLIAPPQAIDRSAYFAAYGRFIGSLGGQFITAVDMGTTVADMDRIATTTRHVLCTSAGHGDPSEYTAYGVYQAIRASLQARHGDPGVGDRIIAIQGVGKVGGHLAALLDRDGAQLILCDSDPGRLQSVSRRFGATRVGPGDIFSVECDVFAPCAFGGIVNESSVNHFRCGIICGAANNQLGSDATGDRLHRRDIFYAPDYVVNSAGLMHVVMGPCSALETGIAGIHDRILEIHRISRAQDEPANRVADRMAREILYAEHMDRDKRR